MTVRSWAFSFDGYGGDGHILVELWNRQRQRWQMQDVFNNYYFVDGSDEPLSAAEFRTALQALSPGLRLHSLHPGARPGYAIEHKAWSYFRRGAQQWYLLWGNNVFAVDNSPSAKALSVASRELEQLGAIAEGVYPRVRLLAEPANQSQRAWMHALRYVLLASLLLAALGLVLLIVGRGLRLLSSRHA